MNAGDAALELLERKRARKNCISYAQHTYPAYKVNWHHEEIAKHFDELVDLDSELDRLMLFTPPRHGKSELVTVRGNAYYLGHHPEHSIIGACYADSLARTFSRAVRNTILAQSHQRLFRCHLRTEADTSWQIAGRGDDRPSYIAAGVGGGISGQGAHLFNLDDPIKNAEEADSIIMRESHWNWYNSTARTRLMPGGRVVLTMTRWHEDDLAGRLIKTAMEDKRADQWRVVVLPATNDSGEEAYILETRTGKKTFFKAYEALWPGAYDREELDRIRAGISPRWWNALYQQSPHALAGGIIQRDWFRYYTELPNKFDFLTQSWDMSFKDNRASSYVAGQIWARFKTTRHYLLDQWRDHAGFAKTCGAVRLMSEKWPAAALKLVEDKANGPAIIEALEEMGGFIPIEPIGSKPARLEAVSGLYQSGGVYHPHPSIAPWVASLEDELMTAPNNTYWDQADCVSQYLNWIRMKSVGNPESIMPSQVRQLHSYLGSY